MLALFRVHLVVACKGVSAILWPNHSRFQGPAHEGELLLLFSLVFRFQWVS